MQKSDFINIEYIKTIIKERPENIHKGDCGKVLVIAGSKGMAGAAVLCARGALRAGAGLVRIYAAEELFPILQCSVPEATCISRDGLLPGAKIKEHDAIAIGPGLGDHVKNAKLIGDLLMSYEKTIVLDADGINTLCNYDLLEILRDSRANVIITPHYGEAVRLLQHCKVNQIQSLSRPEMARTLAEQTGAICVLKGQGTIVAIPQTGSDTDRTENPAVDLFTNTTGNPGMATGGSGDVLTGIIAALAGQDLDPIDAAKAGVFIHGLAGDLCAESLGETGMTAQDIAEKTAQAFKIVLKK